jgi:kynureninase
MTKPFKAEPGARGFQLSNPPIFQAASLLASLDIFNSVGMAQLRAKSLLLTAYLQLLLQQIEGVSFITPTDPDQRGCQVWDAPPLRALRIATRPVVAALAFVTRHIVNQVSIFVAAGAEAMFHALESR